MNKNNFQKLNKWIAVATIFFIVSSLGGCQMEDLLRMEMEDDVFSKSSENLENASTRSSGLVHETWAQQLDYLVNESPEMDFITNRGLRLVGYKVLDYSIDKDAPLADDTFMPLYNDPADPNNFVILSLAGIKQVSPGTGERYENGLKQILLGDYTQDELMNVELTWSYGNELFTTICFVIGKEVIYDDILSNIRRVVISEPESGMTVTRTAPRLKREGENEDNGQDGPIYYYGMTPHVYIHSWSGGMLAYAYCTYRVDGYRTNGVEYIESAECNPNSWSQPGYYYADADIRVIALFPGREIDEAAVYFAYGCVVSYDFYVSIIWDDFESKYVVSSIYPPYDSLIGNLMVTPSMLDQNY